MKDIKKDAKGDECIFINYSDGAPGGVGGTEYGWDGVEFTRRAVNKMKGLGMSIISYFIDNRADSHLAKDFRKMYGPEDEFIDSTSLIEMSKSLNRKFIELGDAV
jgi:nitric oxide reductase activation protein